MTELDWFNKPVEKSRDLILKEAFKLFLQNNIEKVTVPELERVTKLQRGAIFYHFKDKEAIFEEAIDTYFFSPLNIFHPLRPEQTCSLDEYWKQKMEHLNRIANWFKKERIALNPYFSFFHLAEQANLYIPTFSKKMVQLIDSDKQNWKNIAQSNYLVREQKMDVDAISNMYRSFYIEQCYTSCYSTKKILCSHPSNILMFLNNKEKGCSCSGF